jgi:1-acyl-sn-glycerol-3-phosphate acyltransferase
MKFPGKWVLRATGWRIINSIPQDLKKYVIAVAPHTSWKDFCLGLVVRSVIGRKVYYLGKKELFDSPVGFFFHMTGGKPVNRKINTGLVEQVAGFFKTEDEFAIALAPEGTRKKVQHFKTGFYYIARKAEVPIIVCILDYENKEVKFLPPFYTTNDPKKDMDYIWSLFKDVRGARPSRSITGEREP